MRDHLTRGTPLLEWAAPVGHPMGTKKGKRAQGNAKGKASDAPKKDQTIMSQKDIENFIERKMKATPPPGDKPPKGNGRGGGEGKASGYSGSTAKLSCVWPVQSRAQSRTKRPQSEMPMGASRLERPRGTSKT